MTTLDMSIKPGVGPVLKIMRNDADDPWTTPNEDYGKFIFNSETSLISYILGILTFDYGGPSVYPPGTSSFSPRAYWVTPYHLVTSFTLSSTGWYYEQHYFDATGHFGLSYDPITEIRRKIDVGNNELNGQIFDFITTRQGGPGVPGSGNATMYNVEGLGPQVEIDALNIPGTFTSPPFVTTMNSGQSVSRRTSVLSAWEPPAANEPYELPAATPIAGQDVLLLKPDFAAMARPGFDVNTATGRQFIFNSNRVPAKILAAGELTLAPNGTQTVMLADFAPLSPHTYVDALARQQTQPLFHPPLPPIVTSNVNEYQRIFGYEVQPDRVVFRSTRSYTVIVRYLICADDDLQQTTGGDYDVLRGDPDLGYVQICAPGAQNPPRLKDILVDSRLPYLPIIANGYIPRAAFNNANTETSAAQVRGTHFATPITFANDGSFKPFLKYARVAEHTGGRGGPPFASRFWNNPNQGDWHSKYTRDTFIAEIQDNSITFFGNPNNPDTARWYPAGGGSSEFQATFQGQWGVRYYVLAIPT